MGAPSGQAAFETAVPDWPAWDRRRGIGSALFEELIRQSEHEGIWTLQGATFPENLASRRLQRSYGFREVGYRERIAQHNGIWRDTILMERRSRAVGVSSNARPPAAES